MLANQKSMAYSSSALSLRLPVQFPFLETKKKKTRKARTKQQQKKEHVFH